MDIEINMQSLKNDINVATEEMVIIKDEMHHMFDTIMELDAMWDGAASDAFKQQFNIDTDMFEKICKDLSEFINWMTQSNDLYNKCEKSVASMVKSIRV